MSDPTTKSIEDLTFRLRKAEAELRFAHDAATEQGRQLLEQQTRIAALESQVATMTEASLDRLGNPIDPERYEVYRDAAVIMSTYMAGVRGSDDSAHIARWERMWGGLVDRVDLALNRDPSVHPDPGRGETH